MKRAIPLIVIGVLCCAAVVLYSRKRPPSSSVRIQRAIRRYRSMGIITSGTQTQIPSPPDSENAALVYSGWKSLLRSKAVNQRIEYDLPKLLDFNMPDSDLKSQFNLIDAGSEELSLISRASRLPYCVFKKDWSQGPMVASPKMADMRAMVRWLRGESGALARRGKAIDAIEALSIGYRVEKQILQTRTQLNYISALSMDTTVTRGLLRLAERFRSRNDALRAIQATISTSTPYVSEGDYLATEVLMLVDTANMMRLPESQQRAALGVPQDAPGAMSVIGVMNDLSGGSAAGTVNPKDALSARADIQAWKEKRIPIVLPVIQVQPPRSEARRYGQWVDDNEALALETCLTIMAARNSSADKMTDAAYDACTSLAPELRKYMSSAIIGGVLKNKPPGSAGNLEPSRTSLACLYVNMIFAELRLQHVTFALATHAVARAAAEVFLYKNAHGAYPTSVEQLSDNSLIDPFGGKLLKYRRSGEGFVVYSVGAMGTYDGWPTKESNSEARYVFPPARANTPTRQDAF